MQVRGDTLKIRRACRGIFVGGGSGPAVGGGTFSYAPPPLWDIFEKCPPPLWVLGCPPTAHPFLGTPPLFFSAPPPPHLKNPKYTPGNFLEEKYPPPPNGRFFKYPPHMVRAPFSHSKTQGPTKVSGYYWLQKCYFLDKI